MSELEHYRKKIDEIDTKLTQLIEERMDTVLKSVSIKTTQLAYFNQDREEQVIQKY